MNHNISNFTFKIQTFFVLGLFLLSAPFLRGQTEESADSLYVEENKQAEEPIEDKTKMVWVSLYGGSGLSQWSYSHEAVTTEPVMAFGGGVGIHFRILGGLEISTGTGISSFSHDIKVDDFSAQLSAIDSEGEEYEKRNYASNVVEEQEFLWLRIPLSAKYVFSPGRWGIFAEAGAEYRMPMESTFSQTGTFSHYGYYSQYDLLIDDLPSLGFYDQETKNASGDLNPEDLILPFVGLGVIFPGRKSHFFLEGRYYLESNDPFPEKQEVLFPGPAENQSEKFYDNPSVTQNGEVFFSGFRGVIGIRF